MITRILILGCFCCLIPLELTAQCLSYYIHGKKDTLQICLSESTANIAQPNFILKKHILQFLASPPNSPEIIQDSLDFFIEKYGHQKNDIWSLLLHVEKTKRYTRQGEFQLAIATLNQNFLSKYKNQTHPNILHLLAKGYSFLASAHTRRGQYDKAIESAIQLEKIAKQHGDPQLLLDAYSTYVKSYGDLASPEYALGTAQDRARYESLLETYQKKSYELALQGLGDKKVGVAAYNLAVSLSMRNRLEESKTYLNKAISLGIKTDFKKLLFNAYDVFGDIYMDEKNLDSCFYYIQLGEELAHEMGNYYLLARAEINFANYYNYISSFRQADIYLKKLLENETVKENLKLQQTTYKLGFELEKKRNNHQKALDYYLQFRTVKDSIINEKNTAAIEELKTKYESEIKDKEIKSLSTQTNLQAKNLQKKNYLIGLTVASAFIFTGFLYFFFQQKQKLEREQTLNAKQKLLRTQLNPHFLFNALNAIQQYIYQKENPQKVADYLAKFSRLTRRILQNSKENYISLEEELGFIQDYMDMQKIRFDRPFSYFIEVEEDLDLDEILIPPMFTQPFIENSIEHGIFSKKENGEIYIKIKKEKEMLVVTLEDNGLGVEKTKFIKKSKNHRSMAINITRERLSIMEKKLKRKTELLILDISENNSAITGTKVQLKFPLIYQ